MLKITVIKEKKKIIYIIISIILFFILLFNINRLLPLSFKSYSRAVDLANSWKSDNYCHEFCLKERFESLELISEAAEKGNYQGLDKLFEYVAEGIIGDEFNNFVILYFLENGHYIDKEYFQDYIAKNINNNNINYMLKTKIIKQAGFERDLQYDLRLKDIIRDNDVSLTQRKAALRALWSTFSSENADVFKSILKDPQSETELKIEAIKALSNIDNKDKYLISSDLNIYHNLLKKKNLKLEESIIFILHDYKQRFAKKVNKIVENHNFANSNYLLANNLLNN